jgi:hypothetical protein
LTLCDGVNHKSLFTTASGIFLVSAILPVGIDFTSLPILFPSPVTPHLIPACQYLIVFETTAHTAGITTFSSTGVATAHIVPCTKAHFAISQAVVSLPFSSIGIQAPVIAHTVAHCAVLHKRVGASFVGHTDASCPAHTINLPVFAPALSSVIRVAISHSSCPVSCIHSAHRNPHTFHTCSLTIPKAPTLASNQNFAAFFQAGRFSFLFSFTACIASFISTQSFAIAIRACASCCDTCPSFSCLFSLIASSASCSATPSAIIASKACFSFTNRFVGHLFGTICGVACGLPIVACCNCCFCVIIGAVFPPILAFTGAFGVFTLTQPILACTGFLKSNKLNLGFICVISRVFHPILACIV